MKRMNSYWAALGLVLASCAGTQFTAYQVENFGEVSITQSESKIISLQNPDATDVQNLVGVGFSGGTNAGGEFRIEKVMVGDRVVQPSDIKVPPGSSINIQVTYQPRDLTTTEASYGGLISGAPVRPVPQLPGETQQAAAVSKALHRAVILAVYDEPKQGIVELEVRGTAVPGPNGEVALPEAGKGGCTSGEGRACFVGKFLIDIPKFFTTGFRELESKNPIPFHIIGAQSQMYMDEFPPVLLVLEGNGPGEPLEGQPVPAVSIVISGVPAVVAGGTFDGSRIEMKDVAFRIRVVAGKIKQDDISSGMPALVDFKIEGLNLTTKDPLTDGHIVMEIRTTLSDKPSGNPIFDKFLGGADIIVNLDGDLSL